MCWYIYMYIYKFFLQLTINVHTLIYCEHIKGFINLLLWWLFTLWWYYFSKKNLHFGSDIFNNLLTFLYFSKQCHSYPLHPNFFETSIGISNKLHQLEINSYFNFETSCFEMNFFYFHFKYFYLNMKVHISNLKKKNSI